MYIYTAYNLCIHSEIYLPELPVAEGSPDVVLRLGSLGTISEETLTQQNHIFGDLPGIGKFFFRAGQEVIIEPEPGVDEYKLRVSIPGSVMAVLLQQRGLLVLHASSVAINNKVVAFMGASGWGKSTLAKAFHAQGYDIVTDDVMAIQTDAGSPIVFPAFPQVKLLPDAAASLGYSRESLPALFPNASKLSYKFTKGFQSTPLPLQRIYVLDKGTGHEIISLSPQEAFAELLRHTRATSLLTNQDFAKSHFDKCTTLVREVSFCRFLRKPSLIDLPQLVNLVEDDVAQLSDQDSERTNFLAV
ncbi:MAG: hypothetical protein KME28_07400 [Pelatocladus maniniholoensis HA4357-MV3]|jgi:hypothetical protein|uniref:Uncharacterized protein n=1 Tax=Pelatocladus maniniholoensis HA4357-MV3 TaxID=1117104 RepID=A0A9E3H631_9NOST|nr:hypothetical protein [Pelatocladus maniniholoensis HA4357-MV3]